jgi:hypothetical protein
MGSAPVFATASLLHSDEVAAADGLAELLALERVPAAAAQGGRKLHLNGQRPDEARAEDEKPNCDWK